MSLLRAIGVAGVLATAGCLSDPSFDRASADLSSEGMVLVHPAPVMVSSGKEEESDREEREGEDGSKGGSAEPAPGASAAPVTSFWIDVNEVSANDYIACIAAGACSPAGTGSGCTTSTGLGNHPVTCVTRSQAATFCAWKQKRLLSPEEWTTAAGGGGARTYPWSSDPPDPARLNGCGAECTAPKRLYSASDGSVMTAPVGSFAQGRTPDGVYDLAGNVAEWVDGARGLVLGGSYVDGEPGAVAATASRGVSIESAEPTIGFRCGRDP